MTKPKIVIRECKQHGKTEYILESCSNGYRCKKCRTDSVAKRRRKVKDILVEEAGGKCLICGYDKCVAALQFHHLDPTEKSFGIAAKGATRSLDALREEAKKCALLCCRCHAEVEAGITELP